MVNSKATSFKFLKFLFIVALQLYPCIAISSGLNISVNTHQVELGKPVKLLIESQQTDTSLEAIDLTSLKKDFHIKSRGDIEINNSKQKQVVVLYPRTTGELFIPEIHFHNSATKPLALLVTPATDPKDGSQLDVRYFVSTQSPWKNQQLQVRLDVKSQSSILVLRTPDAFSEHSEIISTNMLSEPISSNLDSSIHSTGWAIFPHKTGSHILDLPAIQLVRDGVTTHRFYPPFIRLEIKPLPIYIPVTMPVGQLEFIINSTPFDLIFADTIYKIELKLRALGVSPKNLPSLSAQLHSNKTINFYPAKREHTEITTKYGLVSDEIYLVNFKVNQQGLNSLGELKLNYFDPDSGTIKTIRHHLGNRFVLGNSLLILSILMVIIPGYFLISIIYRWLSKKWHCLSGYYQVFLSVPYMNNPEDIKNGLMRIASAEKWHSNTSLQQWHRQWSKKYNHQPCPLNMNHLEMMLYGNKQGDVLQLRQGIRRLCLQRWPALNIL